MMHAREKSDSAIVAGKPTNKADRNGSSASWSTASATGASSA